MLKTVFTVSKELPCPKLRCCSAGPPGPSLPEKPRRVKAALTVSIVEVVEVLELELDNGNMMVPLVGVVIVVL